MYARSRSSTSRVRSVFGVHTAAALFLRPGQHLSAPPRHVADRPLRRAPESAPMPCTQVLHWS